MPCISSSNSSGRKLRLLPSPLIGANVPRSNLLRQATHCHMMLCRSYAMHFDLAYILTRTFYPKFGITNPSHDFRAR